MSALEQKWRWLCVECDTEGQGWKPERCPTCGLTDSWYMNNSCADDPRTMTQILADDIFEHLKDKKIGK
ncbi:hypothetical protein [Ochrobactrum chromiisoli]|uniref:Rubredoxin-like domain-containing protein n=1 Tax=Ochrobactrum chromiisoli TaxID=2993941 RepID=A0ABT3QKT3_9HYPH|nr:hypothetical protein [Ochrobactrum chromiisoli]MCX2696222.1 hypothetical protein [Ochrobactrum chromiisoli]